MLLELSTVCMSRRKDACEQIGDALADAVVQLSAYVGTDLDVEQCSRRVCVASTLSPLQSSWAG